MRKIAVVAGPGAIVSACELSERLGLRAVNASDLIRDHLQRATPVGKQMDGYVRAGAVIAADLLTKVVCAARVPRQRGDWCAARRDGSSATAVARDDTVPLAYATMAAMTGQDTLEHVVRAELEEEADRFLGLVRPAIRLNAAGPGDPVAGHINGAPAMPPGMPWPTYGADRPLWLVASVRLAALAGMPVDVDLPADGTLLFFVPNFEDSGIFDVPGCGAQLLYVPPGGAEVRQPPPGTEIRPVIPLTATSVTTWPTGAEPVLRREYGDFARHHELLWEREANDSDLFHALCTFQMRTMPGPRHQIGGYVESVQNPVALEAAAEALGHGDYDDPAFWEEAERWVLLLQIDEDTGAELTWGDGASVRWAIRADDLKTRAFDRVHFTIDGH